MMRVAFVVALCIAVVAVSAENQDPNPNGSYSKVFNYSGGLAFCSQCGAPGQYACSNQANFPTTVTWTDSIPTGSVPTAISVTTRGSYKCNKNYNTFGVEINGIELDILTATGSSNVCECNTCDGDVTFQNNSPYGWPGYNVGGANTLRLKVFSDQLCLNSVNLTVHYTKDFYNLQTKYVEVLSTSSSYNVCGSPKATSITSSGSFSFKDPVPSGHLPVAVAVDVFGKYFYSSQGRCYTTYGLKVAVAGNELGSLVRKNTYFNQTQVYQGCNLNNDGDCNGRWSFRNGKFYQNGIPTWKYGGDNTVSLTQTSSYPQYSRVARVGVWVYYVAKPSEE